MTNVVMWDSIDPSQIPSSARAVAGYVGGSWPDYSREVALFPHALHISVAVSWQENAHCGDCETGDMSPEQLAQFLKRQLNNGVKEPWGYGPASSVQAIINAAHRIGIDRSHFMVWSAHIGRGAHICAPDVCGYPRADGTQHTFNAGGRDVDESLCGAQMFNSIASPVKNDLHYDWYETAVHIHHGRVINERGVVEEYDKLRPHWAIHHPRLVHLREEMQTLARHISAVEQQDRKSGIAHPGARFHRGWRYANLVKRGFQAQRFV